MKLSQMYKNEIYNSFKIRWNSCRQEDTLKWSSFKMFIYLCFKEELKYINYSKPEKQYTIYLMLI